MRKNFFKEELLSEEQLDEVVGGNYIQSKVDKRFFEILGYNMDNINLKEAFLDNGVRFDEGIIGDNVYKIFSSSSCKFENYPHWAALGYILSRRGHPDFKGNWTNKNDVKWFFGHNFDGIDAFN